MVIVNTSGSGAVLITQNGCRGGRYGVLRAVAHELRDRTSYVSDTDVFTSHHDVVEVSCIQASERNIKRFVVAGVPGPALESEVVILMDWIMQAERSGVL